MKHKFLSAAFISLLALTGLTACAGKGTAVGTNTTAEANAATATSGSGQTGMAAGAETDGGKAATGEQVTLNLCWWGNQTRNDVTKRAVELYMSEHPNINIQVEFTDWSGYWDKLSAMAAGGNLPDIIQQDYSYLNQYQKSGQLADLTPFLNDGTINTDKIPESIIKSGSIDGKCYAISLGSNAPVMVYDKAVVEQAGVSIPEQMTIDEFYDVCQSVFDKTGTRAYFEGGINMLQFFARSQGKLMFEELSANQTSATSALFSTFEKFNQADFCISPDILAEKDPAIVETKPIIDGTTWNDFQFSNQLISTSNIAGRELSVTMFPKPADAVEQPMYLKPSQFFSIAETSQHKKEAAEFLNWFTNSIECNEILMAERGIPINTEVAEALKAKVDPVTQTIFDYINAVGKVASPIDPPDPSGKGEIEALLKTTGEDMRYGELSAADATVNFTAAAQKILQEAAK